MSEEVKREDMKPGEWYKVEFEGEFRHTQVLSVGTGIGMRDELPCGWIPSSATITRLPPKAKPLKVGETVLMDSCNCGGYGKVKAVCGALAWVEWGTGGHQVLWSNMLCRSSGIPICEPTS